MRWDRLFDDLEGQLEQGLGAEDLDLAVEEERLRLGRLRLRERLAAMAGAGGAPLVVQTAAGAVLALRVQAVGRDWIAGELAGEGARGRAVVPIPAIAALRPTAEQLAAGVERGAAPTAEPLSARLPLAVVLRDLCRRRAPTSLRTWAGTVHGTIDRVARDHLDLAEHEPGEQRRADAVRAIRLVPMARIDHLRY